MNKSFKRQIFFSLMLLVIILFFVLNVSSRQLLENYYFNQRKGQLEDISKRIEKTQGNLRINLLTATIEDRLGGDILILDTDYSVVFSTKSPVSTRRLVNNKAFINRLKTLEKKSGEISFFTRVDEEENPIQLIGVYETKDNQFIMTQLPLETIESTLRVIRVFFFMVSIAFFLISLLLSIYMSGRIGKPLSELNEKTKKLKAFNFDVAFKSKRQDEIGELTESIGALSNALEEKIKALEDHNMLLKKEMGVKDQLIENRQSFIANISHELKTPLALIQAYAEGLKDGTFEDAEDQEYYLRVITEESQHMDHLIKELIDLMKLEVKLKDLKIEEINLLKLMKKALKPFEETLDQRGIHVKIDGLTEILKGDQAQLEMAFRNLISNAIDHVDDKKLILIDSQIEDDKVRVGIFNTGENIPKEDLNNIWEPFYKVDKSRNRQFGGSGIGLSIVKEVFENHGFHYGVSNHREGVGFYFYFPKI